MKIKIGYIIILWLKALHLYSISYTLIHNQKMFGNACHIYSNNRNQLWFILTFRQAFLLSQYALFVYNILSVQTHNICNIFLTDGKQNSWLFNHIVFILVAKISRKRVYEKMENNSMLGKILLVYNRNAELFLRRMRKKNVIILKSLQKKRLQSCVLFVCRCWHLSCRISIEIVRKIVLCSLNVLMTVLYLIFFSQYYDNLRFYWAIINLIFLWNIDLNNGVYCDLRNKNACLKRY